MSDAKAEKRLVLASFLRNIAEQIENDTLSKPLRSHTKDFFMSYQFIEQAVKDNHLPSDNIEVYSAKDLVKFLFLGWYCYSLIGTRKILDNIEKISESGS